MKYSYDGELNTAEIFAEINQLEAGFHESFLESCINEVNKIEANYIEIEDMLNTTKQVDIVHHLWHSPFPRDEKKNRYLELLFYERALHTQVGKLNGDFVFDIYIVPELNKEFY